MGITHNVENESPVAFGSKVIPPRAFSIGTPIPTGKRWTNTGWKFHFCPFGGCVLAAQLSTSGVLKVWLEPSFLSIARDQLSSASIKSNLKPVFKLGSASRYGFSQRILPKVHRFVPNSLSNFSAKSTSWQLSITAGSLWIAYVSSVFSSASKNFASL